MRAVYANHEATAVVVTFENGRAGEVVPPDAPILAGVEIEPYVPSVSATPRTCFPREFRDRFSPQEKGALTLAASRALEAGDPTLQVFLDDLAAAQTVELDHPALRAGMDFIVAAGLITAERAAAVLAA